MISYAELKDFKTIWYGWMPVNKLVAYPGVGIVKRFSDFLKHVAQTAENISCVRDYFHLELHSLVL